MPPSNEIFSKNFLNKAVRKADLLSKLSVLLESLKSISQEKSERPKGIEIVNSQLISDKILNNADKEVQLLATCCIVEILRIFAPEAPYNNEELLQIFRVIVSQLRSLSTCSIETILNSKIYSILSSLSSVKSGVVLVCLANDGLAPANELILNLFECLVDSIRPDHPDEIGSHIANLFIACFEEFEIIDQSLLDIVLFPLLPSSKAENPAAYSLCQIVLRKSLTFVSEPICKFVNYVLVGTEASPSMQESELADHIYPLIFELHTVDSSFIKQILPNVATKLQSEDEDSRLKSVKLLGALFASLHANYGLDFPRNFRDFLGRFSDVSVNVRLEMVDNGALIIKKKANLRSLVENLLMNRLRDLEEEVRHVTIVRLYEIAADNPSALQSTTYQEIGLRAKDKRPAVRKEAILSLAKLYCKYISSVLPPITTISHHHHQQQQQRQQQQQSLTTPPQKGKKRLSSETEIEAEVISGIGNIWDVVNDEHWSRLGFVPGYVINCWGWPKPEDKHFIVQLLQERIIPRVFVPLTSLPKPSQHVPYKAHNYLSDSDSEDEDEEEEEAGSHGVNHPTDEGIDKESGDMIDRRRANALRLLSLCLQEKDRDILGAILSYKTRVRKEIEGWLSYHMAAVSTFTSNTASSRSSSSSSTTASNIHKVSTPSELNDFDLLHYRTLMHRVQLVAPPLDRKVVLLDKLLGCKDKTVFRLLHSLVSPEMLSSKLFEDRNDLCSRVGTHSALGVYLKSIIDISSYLLMNQDIVGHLLELVSYVDESMVVVGGEEGNIQLMLSLFSKHCPQLFEKCNDQLSRWLTNSFPDDLSSGSEQSQTISVMSESRSTNLCISIIRQAAPYLGKRENLLKALVDTALTHKEIDPCESLMEVACKLLLPLRRNTTTTSTTTSSKPLFPSPSMISYLIKASQLLLSPKRLTIASLRLPCDLTILAAMVSSGTVLTAAQLDFLFEFIRNILCLEQPSRTQIPVTPPPRSLSQQEKIKQISEKVPSPVLAACLKLWTAIEMLPYLSSLQAEDDHESHTIGISQPVTTSGTMTTTTSTGTTRQKEETLSTSSGSTSNTRKEELELLVDLLFKSVRSQGKVIGDIQIEKKSDHIVIRQAAATCLLDLIKLKVVGKVVTVTQWHDLGWALLDSDPTCRRRIVRKLSQVIQTHSVHPRFLAYPSLLANDDNLVTIAGTSFTFAVRRLRCTYEELCCDVTAIETDGKERDHLAKLAADNMPECILPYALHLLSHHPDFPSASEMQYEGGAAAGEPGSSDDKRRMRGIVRSIKMVLDTLIDSTSTSSSGFGHTNKPLSETCDNLPFLIKQVDLIVQYFDDRIEPGNMNLNFAAKLARKMLYDKARTVHCTQPYLYDVPLPMDIYIQIAGNTAINATNTTTTSSSSGYNYDEMELLEYAATGGEVEEVEDRILRRVLQGSKASPKGNKSSSTSSSNTTNQPPSHRTNKDTSTSLAIATGKKTVPTTTARKTATKKTASNNKTGGNNKNVNNVHRESSLTEKSNVNLENKDEDEGDYEESKLTKKKNLVGKKQGSKARKGMTAPISTTRRPQVEATRRLPSRSTRAVVSYEEKDVIDDDEDNESNEEVEEEEEMIAVKPKPAVSVPSPYSPSPSPKTTSTTQKQSRTTKRDSSTTIMAPAVVRSTSTKSAAITTNTEHEVKLKVIETEPLQSKKHREVIHSLLKAQERRGSSSSSAAAKELMVFESVKSGAVSTTTSQSSSSLLTSTQTSEGVSSSAADGADAEEGWGESLTSSTTSIRSDYNAKHSRPLLYRASLHPKGAISSTILKQTKSVETTKPTVFTNISSLSGGPLTVLGEMTNSQIVSEDNNEQSGIQKQKKSKGSSRKSNDRTDIIALNSSRNNKNDNNYSKSTTTRPSTSDDRSTKTMSNVIIVPINKKQSSKRKKSDISDDSINENDVGKRKSMRTSARKSPVTRKG